MVEFDFWACQRPLTRHWGSGQVLDRLRKKFGSPDVAFGKQDQVDGLHTVDIDPASKPTTVADWRKLPFKDNEFEFGYWDPPYDKLYKAEGIEIFRTVKRIAILHTHVWPRAWLEKVAPVEREAMVAVTMGPMKATRMLQIFRKTAQKGQEKKP